MQFTGYKVTRYRYKILNSKLINRVLILTILVVFTACKNIGGIDKYTHTLALPIEQNGSNTNKSLESKFINSINCDKIIDKVFYKICYDKSYRASKCVAYTLEGDLVNEKNIKERPRFYPEETINDPYRAYYKDYTNSGYDRGHLAPDAAFDWSEESLNSVYSLANIIPQDRNVNEHQWVKAEEHARKMAVKYIKIKVLNIIIYPKNSKTIGEDNISVSKGFYKIMYNKSQNYKECFYYENNASMNKNTLNGNKVDCEVVIGN